MKQQYESEILFHLMERDGFNIPSSVPPYEAEIKAYLINQVKQAYPKLTDYEAEWLLYNYTKHLPADFPISSVTNVTKATFENVVPFAYKSAILKGQTLVNLLRTKYLYCNLPTSEEVEMDSSVNAYDANNARVKQINLNQNIQANKKYLIMLNITQLETGKKIAVYSKTTSGEEVYDIPNFYGEGLKCVMYTPKSDVKEVCFYVDFNNENKIIAKMKQPMIIEYQDGMENWDIPYFEGMQSVKMPVLTTTGKNLFNSTFEKHTLDWGTGVETTDPNVVRTVSYTRVKPNESYVITKQNISGALFYYDKNKSHIKTEWVYPVETVNFTTTSDTHFIKMFLNTTETEHNIQLEQGTQATSYEPYKSNILTVNEEVELRGIGEVKDELNLLTGELTQRVGVRTFNGSGNWTKSGASTDELFGGVINVTDSIVSNANVNIYSDRFVGSSKIEPMSVYHYNNHSFRFFVPVANLISNDLNGFKDWMSKNPITIQYELGEKTIKTVDLKKVNESGESIYFMPLEGTMHIHSNGSPLKPTITMEVPVEATTQNLASFIGLEVEE